jgi:hypothetical protein
MEGLCKFKNIFGEPGKGVHSHRFMGVAIVDYALTILLAILVTKLTKLPLVISTILCFVMGIVLHALFCVPTQATIFLGLV